MHDNTSRHTAAITKQFLATSNANVLDWPANSPDHYPIEHIWDELGRRVRRNHAIHTVNDLAAAVLAEWANLHAPLILRYVNNIRRRITTCIAQNGGHIRY
jgi:transposase